jgi:hypothetical protein
VCASVKLLTFLRFVGAATALWLSTAGSAWAGDGGAALAPLQHILNGTCTTVGISAANCPQLPTINQLVIEIAALANITPNTVRNLGNVPQGHAIDAGSQPGLANPLAFISAPDKSTAPIPTQPSNPLANSFISATNTNGTLNLNFDYLPRTNPNFALNQDVGDIVLPFVVADASGNAVRDLSATLQIRGTGGTSVNTDVVGDFLGTGTPQVDTLAQLDMTFSLSFASGHSVYDIGAPLLVTAGLASGFPSPRYAGFEFDPTAGLFEGINPVATFLTANFVNDANDPFAANADLAITESANTILSDPLPEPEPSTLALLGGGLWALVLLRRRQGAQD